ncbi:MAG: LptF/LptG family permease [Candidatus Cloacimonas sp.]|nr:LptF/LptG family permease [Candidatus Cloacimonadota bacterium]
MKILERYILKENIKPFLISFMIVTFVFLLDKLIDLLNLIVEKRLEIPAIISVFSLSLPFMLALSVPMSVLVATIMAFGRLSVDNELVAFKSCGINIYTLMRSTVIAALLLSVFMVYFNNAILPDTNHKLKNLLIRIQYRRPVTNIKPGVFTNVKNYTIYVSDIQDDELQGVVIYNKETSSFPQTITADRGTIELSDGGNSFKATLFDGQLHKRDDRDVSLYTIQQFERLVIHLPDLGYQLNIEDSEFRSDREMSSKQMGEAIKDKELEIAGINEQIQTLNERNATLLNHSDGEEQTVDYKKNANLLEMHQNKIGDLEGQIRELQVEIHKKYAIAFACLVFVFIGIPIGMMIKSSGVGVAFTTSALIFVFYYACLVGGEQLGDKGIISPWLSMWAPNILFASIGLWLVISSTSDMKTLSLDRWKEKLSKIADKVMLKRD